MVKGHEYMRMSELVKRSGVPRTTIHFYLRQGLLHAPTKTGRTMAYYDESHLTRLRTIQEMRKDMRLPVAFLKERLDELHKGEADAIGGGVSSELPDQTGAQDPRERRRQQIIQAAIRVFSEKGYHRAKVEDITRAVGISTGTFYIYFTNKRELFMEVVDDVFRTIVGDAAKAIRGEESHAKRYAIRLRVFYDNYTKYAEVLHLLRAEIASVESWPREKLSKIYHGFTEPVIKDFRRAIEQGDVPQNIDPDLFIYAMIGMTEMLGFRATLDQKYSVDQIMNFLLDLVDSYLSQKARQVSP